MIFKQIVETFKRPSQLAKATPQNEAGASYQHYWGTNNTLVQQVHTDPRTWVKRFGEMIDHDVYVRTVAMMLQLLMSQMTFKLTCGDDDEEDEETQELAQKLFLDWKQH
ncbi:MAG: hypothetical protein ACKO96_26875, partial [Flammeovirgaceae bacterium]